MDRRAGRRGDGERDERIIAADGDAVLAGRLPEPADALAKRPVHVTKPRDSAGGVAAATKDGYAEDGICELANSPGAEGDVELMGVVTLRPAAPAGKSCWKTKSPLGPPPG
jgi:hypothetical protein